MSSAIAFHGPRATHARQTVHEPGLASSWYAMQEHTPRCLDTRKGVDFRMQQRERNDFHELLDLRG